jgi:DNA polymerase-1
VREARGFRTVGHNLAFDQDMAWKVGIDILGVLEDTQINEGLVNDIATSFSLESCATRHGVTPKLGQELYRAIADKFGGMATRESMGNFWRMPGDHPAVVDYSCGDGITTLELRNAQQKLLDEYDLRRVWELECALIPHLAKMRRRGMKVDMSKAQTIIDDTRAQIAEALKEFPPGFNVLSPKDLEKFFRANGQTEFKLTEQGRPSFTEKLLETSVPGRAVLKIRQLSKAVGSFITPLIDTHNQNGRVHPLLNQSKGDESGVIGGRLSCQDPNMQAFPKRNKVVGKVVRQLIIPDFGELSEADFKQQEPRLFAHFSEDRNLLAAYLADPPLDIHDVSSSILSLPRDVSKRLGLGILTGMGYQALADHMGWTFDEAKRAHNTFLGDAFPGIKDFQTDAKKTMISRGYVRTLLGRRCTVDDNRYAYKAVSRIIQGSGADHTKTALLIACEYCESESDNIDLLMTIHDSFISQHTDRKYRDELSALLANVATKMDVMIPIPVEVGTGANWSVASYGK